MRPVLNIDHHSFLQNNWQKKPLLIKHAFNQTIEPIDINELAGLSMEEDIESRLVHNQGYDKHLWRLLRGPFSEKQLTDLPESHWSLLIQGVDKIVPEIQSLLQAFDFIPLWRFDDVMISLSSIHGGVGPHYDHYDVFLYQASGTKKWSLTTQDINKSNAILGIDLRIMKTFVVEEEYILEAGDMLYLPPHVGHDGVALSQDCITYSFGYRSYQAQELWDGFGDYMSANEKGLALYHDPDWSILKNKAKIPPEAIFLAKKLLQSLLDDEEMLTNWFTQFATTLDQQAYQLLPQAPVEDGMDKASFFNKLKKSRQLAKESLCRMAYYHQGKHYAFSINGELYPTNGLTLALIQALASESVFFPQSLLKNATTEEDKSLLYHLYQQGLLYIL